MAEYHSQSAPVGHIPDYLTIPQFFLDEIDHPARPIKGSGSAWLIEEHTGKKLSREELRERTRNLANGLSIKWKIAEDDVVCIFSPNHVDYPVAIWAIHRLGAIVTPANPIYTVDELVYQLEITRANSIVCHTSSYITAIAAAKKVGIPLDRVACLQGIDADPNIRETSTIEAYIRHGANNKLQFSERKLSPGEAKRKVAFLSSSSGTTGKPKAVIIPHYAVIANVLQLAVHLRLTEPDVRPYGPGDIVAAVLPLFHIYGLVVNLHLLVFAGLSLVVVPKFDFKGFLDDITRYKINVLILVPPQVILMCRQPIVKNYDLSHVKYVVSAASALPPVIQKELSELLPNASIGQGYGCTETCAGVTLFPPTQKQGRVDSVGPLISGVVARIVKEDGSLVKQGEAGELVVTGPSMALGYLDNEQATKETFMNDWVRTGDVVEMRDGEVYIVDRIKELIKVKGFQVSPAELEGHLLTHPAVGDTCVVSILDEYSGELPIAYVVLTSEYARKAKESPSQVAKIRTSVLKHVSDNKIGYKHLKGGVEFIDAIPKNATGKLLRRVLRDEARSKVTSHVAAKL